MAVPHMSPTRLMVMLAISLMSPMMEQLSTQMPQLHMPLPQCPLMLDKYQHQMILIFIQHKRALGQGHMELGHLGRQLFHHRCHCFMSC